jgi:hypothetical protein
MICVAEELLSKARKESVVVAVSGDSQRLQEYQKLIATGLGCLEVVLGSNKLSPRLEARLQLRYASILHEETTNIMEAETALTKGITLCDKVNAPRNVWMFRRFSLINITESICRSEVLYAVPPGEDAISAEG